MMKAIPWNSFEEGWVKENVVERPLPKPITVGSGFKTWRRLHLAPIVLSDGRLSCINGLFQYYWITKERPWHCGTPTAFVMTRIFAASPTVRIAFIDYNWKCKVSGQFYQFFRYDGVWSRLRGNSREVKQVLETLVLLGGLADAAPRRNPF